MKRVANRESNMKRFLFLGTGLVMLLVVLTSIALAQDKHSDKNYQAGVPYAISDIESINTTNGNLMFNFGFGRARGRGTAAQGISLKYNSRLYETHVMEDLDNSGVMVAQQFLRADYEGGWQYDKDYRLRVINRNDDQDQPIQVGGGSQVLHPWQGDGCVYLPPNYKSVYVWKLMMYFPDGSQHEFRPTGYSDESQDQLFGKFQTKDGYFNVDTTGKIRDLSYGSQGPGGGCTGTPYSVSTVEAWDPNSKMVYYSTDGTFMRLEIPNGQNVRNPATWTLYMRDGSKVTHGEPDGSGGQYNQRVYDRNGNFVTKADVTLPEVTLPGQSIMEATVLPGYVDEMGRYIAKRNISSTEDWIYKLGFGGAPIVWRVKWKWITVIKEYTTSGTVDPQQRCCNSDQDLVAQHKVVDEIILPEQMVGDDYTTDPLRYKFTYDAHDGQVAYNPANPNYSSGWGEILSVTVPSGAKAEYDYEAPIAFGADEMLKKMGKIKEKRLIYHTTYDGNPPETVTEKWLYDIKHSDSKITGPYGGVTEQFFYSINADSDLSGRVYKEIRPNGTVVERIWQHNKVGGCPSYGCGSMRRLNTYVKTEFVTIAGSTSPTAIKDFDYDKNGNVTKVTEFDFYFGALPRDAQQIVSGIPGAAEEVRITEAAYYNPTEDASNTTANNLNSYWNSSAKDVNNALASIVVKDASEVPVSRTEITYDNENTTANPEKTKMWDSYNGGSYQAYSNPLAASNSIETLVTYDPYGNVLTTKDANGITTEFTYAAINGHSGLYPTQTKTALGKAEERTTTATYDFYSGLAISTTDVDNGVTNETEYDALGRPVKAIAAANDPLEVWTQTDYNDEKRRMITKSDFEVKGDGKKVAVRHFDELGRLRLARSIENIAIEDPLEEADGIKVQTRYRYDNPLNPALSDGVYTLTSNPYRAATSAAATSEESMGWTLRYANNTGTYSASESFSGATLPGPWGSNTASTGLVTTEADATRTLVTDQAGIQRISETNALGHLTDVWEIKASDPDTVAVTFPSTNISHGYQTSYQYDVLNNLTKVIQGTVQQNREFNYTSLSRLRTAFNPESGTISYVYDNNGNLTQKTDARGVITAYSYDDINRLKERSYSNEPSGQTSTPTVYYTYDNLSGRKGQLTKIHNSYSTTEYTEYDILNRVEKSKQTTDGKAYDEMTYTYNLSGALIETRYPSGRVVKNVLDNDGRLSFVKSQKNQSSAFWDYAQNFTYTAAGAVSSMQLGNLNWESTEFNSRLQPTQIALGANQGGTDRLKLDYTFNTTGYNDNNGNVLTQKITVPTVGTNQGFTADQVYSYDELNRLKSATETGTDGWNQTFQYDRYGNKNFDEGLTTTLTKLCGTDPDYVMCAGDREVENPEIDSATNRIKEFQPDGDQLKDYEYDAAGNTTKDPDDKRFKYDGENKQIEVVQLDSNGNEMPTPIGQYWFDGDGKRVKKYVPSMGETTIFHYDAGGQLIAEYSTIVALPSAAQVSYLTNDHLGSPRITTDKNGEVYSRRDFTPFGEELTAALTLQRGPGVGYAADSVRQKFTGYERDDEISLDFAQARMYNPIYGRFASADPLLTSASTSNVQSWNKYAYALNTPLLLTDPLGLYVFKEGTTDEEKKEFKAALAAAKEALSEIEAFYGVESDEYIDANRALDSYGEDETGEKTNNGVTVGFGELAKGTLGKAAGTVTTSGQNTVSVTIDLDQTSGSDLIATVAHEGSHVQDHSDYQAALLNASLKSTEDTLAVMNGPLNVTHGATETRAFGVSSVMNQFVGGGGTEESSRSSSGGSTTYRFGLPPIKSNVLGGKTIWKSSWRKLDAAEIRQKRNKAIGEGLKQDKRYKHKLDKRFH